MSSRRTGYYGYDPDAEVETVRPAEAAAMRARCDDDDAWLDDDREEPVYRVLAAEAEGVAEGRQG